MRNNLYKSIYNIAVYGPVKEGETLIALLDNAKEFAEFLKTSENSARAILSKLYNKKAQHLVIDNRMVTVEFLNLEE